MSRETSLVTADWVEENLDNDNVVLVEVDEDTSAYELNHIRGAVRIDWQDDLQDPVRRDFVNKEQFEAIAQALLEFETLTGDELRDLMEGKRPNRQDPDEPQTPRGSAVPSAEKA